LPSGCRHWTCVVFREDIYALVDLQRRGQPDGIVFDVHRTGKWNLSFWDEKLDVAMLKMNADFTRAFGV
jgi:hypothetical protein